MSNQFQVTPAAWIPFRDQAVLARLRLLSREELVKHANPEFKINLVLGTEALFVGDMVTRMAAYDRENTHCVMIIPNPAPPA